MKKQYVFHVKIHRNGVYFSDYTIRARNDLEARDQALSLYFEEFMDEIDSSEIDFCETSLVTKLDA